VTDIGQIFGLQRAISESWSSLFLIREESRSWDAGLPEGYQHGSKKLKILITRDLATRRANCFE